jgi:hypothetical protein
MGECLVGRCLASPALWAGDFSTKDAIKASEKAYGRENNSISEVQLRVLLGSIKETERNMVCQSREAGLPYLTKEG